MAIRYLKIVLTIFVSLLGLLSVIQNLVNLDAAYTFVATVLSMEGHNAYPVSVGSAITSPTLIWLTLAVIILGELSVGFLAAKGALDLWAAREAKAAVFHKAKKFAILGAGMAVVVWFGFFTVIAGAYFQMWQTELGGLSLEGAFQYAGASGLILLFINMKDD